MQILIFRQPLFKGGLTFAQRLCYMSSTLFWLFPFPRTMFLIAPLFYLFFDLEIFVGSGGEFLAYTMTYMLVNLLMQNYLYGRFRWPWISELYEYVQTVHLLPAVISVMLNPSKPTFKVTAKDESITQSRLSEISAPFFVIFGVLIVAMGMVVYRLYVEPTKADVTLVVGGWNLLNLIFAGCALGAVTERGDKSAARRVSVKRRCEFKVGDSWYPAIIDNVSVDGMLVHVYDKALAPLKPGSIEAIRVKPYSEGVPDTMAVNIVRSNKGEGEAVSVGCTFAPQRALDHRLIADLMFANSAQWSEFQMGRRRNPGLLKGTVSFLGIAAYQTNRGLYYLLRGLGSAKPKLPVPAPAKGR